MVKIGKGVNRCPECLVPRPLCYCAQITQADNKTPVTIIMHKSERFLTSNTAIVATRALKECNILLRGLPQRQASDELSIKANHVPLVLFPCDDALTIGSHELKEYLDGRPAHLIVPDGTWGQAKRVARREPALANIQAVKLSNTGPSLYRLRRQVVKDRLCTFEAIARAIGDLESIEIEQALLKIMAAMDHAHAMARGVDKFDDGNPDPLTQRLFIEIRVTHRDDQILKMQQQRSDFDWVNPLNDHLTLAFVGRLKRSQKEILMKSLDELRFHATSINFHKLDAFDSKESPSVLWLKPDKQDVLISLSKQVRSIMTKHEIPFDDKPYTPHWTLARTRGIKIAPHELKAWFEYDFNLYTTVHEVVLFEGHGSRNLYQEVKKYKAMP